MTKFILHGGRTSLPLANNKEFFAQIISGAPDKSKILLVYFSRPKEEWQELLEKDKINFSQAAKGKNYELIVASDKEDIFFRQIDSHSIIYMRGGRDPFLKEQLLKINNLSGLFRNKTIAGCSAGANVLSKYYYSTDQKGVREGLGILPIKVFCHYSDKKNRELEELKNYGEKLEILAIPETQFLIKNYEI